MSPESPPAPHPIPSCGADLWATLRDPGTGAPLQREGEWLCGPAGERWPIVRGIPRFVHGDHYVSSFSFEWNTHTQTQLDVHTGTTSSESILAEKTALTPEEVRGKLTLDAGVGAGRFSDVLSRWGARVVGVDLSYAVEAAQANLGERENVLVAQGDIFNLPFAPGTFDLIVSMGVLHHTPDTRAAFERLVPLLRPGGVICIYVYPRTHHFLLRQKWVPFLRRVPSSWFHTWCKFAVPFAQRRPTNPLVQYAYQLFEWSNQGLGQENDILDTFDGYSPYYHGAHSPDEVMGWFRAAGLVDVRSQRWETSVRGTRPLSQEPSPASKPAG